MLLVEVLDRAIQSVQVDEMDGVESEEWMPFVELLVVVLVVVIGIGIGVL
jgi:hypothetical protein